jgi:hypothetical protein
MGILDGQFAKSALLEQLTSPGIFFGSALTFAGTTIVLPFLSLVGIIAFKSDQSFLIFVWIFIIAWLLSGLLFIATSIAELIQKLRRE